MERQLAIALKYKDEDVAPTVVAKGAGRLAEKMLQVARDHDIPIRRQQDVARILSRLEVRDMIPPELFAIVAEILAFVYLVDGKMAAGEIG